MLNKSTSKTAKVAAVQIVIFATLLYGVAIAQGQYQEPTSSPPAGGIDAPVNTGPEDQSKVGMLSVGDPTKSSHAFIAANGTAFSARNAAGNPSPVLLGRGAGDVTYLYHEDASMLKMRNIGNTPGSSAVDRLIISTGGVGAGVTPTQADEADLEIGSKGIKMGDIVQNQWPSLTTSSADLSVPAYPGALEYGGYDSNTVYTCPNGYYMVGAVLERNSNQGDNYFKRILCKQLVNMSIQPVYLPPTTPETPLPPGCNGAPGDTYTDPETGREFICPS